MHLTLRHLAAPARLLLRTPRLRFPADRAAHPPLNPSQLDTIDEWCGAATPDGKCTSCITGFRLTSAGGCEQCSGHKTSDGFERVDACQECPDAKEKCAVCSDGFRADNGACLECPEGCRNCTATECLTCSEGRMFDAAGKTCVEVRQRGARPGTGGQAAAGVWPAGAHAQLPFAPIPHGPSPCSAATSA